MFFKMPGVRAVVKIAALAIANEDAGSQHPRVPHLAALQRGLRRRRSISGRPGARSMRSTWSSTAAREAISRAPGSTPCWRRALDAERGVTALVGASRTQVLKERAASIIERRFVLPHIAHAPLEPVNATASYRDGTVEIWGSDPVGHARARRRCAQAVGCAVDDVKSQCHAFSAAASAARSCPTTCCRRCRCRKAVGRPVKLIALA